MKRISQKFSRLALFVVLGCLIRTSVYSNSLKVKPQTLYFPEVPVGKKFQFRMPLLIYNQSDNTASFILDAIKPSAIRRKWLKGYQEIPNPSWFSFEQINVEIPAHSVANVLMYSNIPKRQSYYNQHYVVTLAIRENTANNQGGGSYAYPQVYLETEMKKWLKEKPAGKIGIIPSIVKLFELKLGENKEHGQFTLYNNDSETHTYTLKTTGEYAFGDKQPMFLTDGYEWLPHCEWLQLKKKVTIHSQENRPIKINVEIPLDESLHKKNYECILFIEDEDKNSSFARLRLEIN